MAVTNNAAARTAAVVLAGGKGTRLDPLTRTICKPALPFGGAFRCIDFSLSNCVNSGVRTIGVATQYEPDALLAHLWDHWNCSAVGKQAVVHAWRAEERAARFGYCGTADAVYRNLGSIRHLQDSLVLVLAGDHVYKMDYRPMLEAHCARQADVTVGCGVASIDDAQHFGVLATAENGRIERFVEKPQSPAEVPRTSSRDVLVSMGIYVFDGALLADVLAADAIRLESGHDFGSDILPRLIRSGRAFAHEFRAAGGARGYWRDVGTLRSFWQTHMDLLGPTPLLTLDDPHWPLGRAAAAPHTLQPKPTPHGGTIEDTIAPADCEVAGYAVRCVLSHGVEVARGARLSECVVLPGAMIGAGCRLRGVIVDAGYRVAEGTVIDGSSVQGEPPVLSTYSAGAARHARTR